MSTIKTVNKVAAVGQKNACSLKNNKSLPGARIILRLGKECEWIGIKVNQMAIT